MSQRRRLDGHVDLGEGGDGRAADVVGRCGRVGRRKSRNCRRAYLPSPSVNVVMHRGISVFDKF